MGVPSRQPGPSTRRRTALRAGLACAALVLLADDALHLGQVGEDSDILWGKCRCLGRFIQGQVCEAALEQRHGEISEHLGVFGRFLFGLEQDT